MGRLRQRREIWRRLGRNRLLDPISVTDVYMPYLIRRNPTQDNAGGWNALFCFGFDDGVEVLAGSQDAGFVVGLSELTERGLRSS